MQGEQRVQNYLVPLSLISRLKRTAGPDSRIHQIFYPDASADINSLSYIFCQNWGGQYLGSSDTNDESLSSLPIVMRSAN